MNILSWSYLAGVAALCGLLWGAGDRWWPATLLTFGPRWVVLVPLPVLVPLALVIHRRALIPLTAAMVLAIGPFMGFCVGWRSVLSDRTPQDRLIRVLSYNCGEGGGHPDFILDFVERTKADVIVMPEGKLRSGSKRLSPDALGGWDVNREGGVFLASRFPILRTRAGKTDKFEAWRHPAVCCELDTPWGVVSLTGVHLATPRNGLQEVAYFSPQAPREMDRVTEGRRIESEMASRLASESAGPSIVAGDFNMPVDSTIYQRYWSGWQNAYSTAGFGFGYTKFTSFIGARIDHVLASSHWQVTNVIVGPDLGGDHRPVVAELTLR